MTMFSVDTMAFNVTTVDSMSMMVDHAMKRLSDERHGDVTREGVNGSKKTP